MFSINHQSNSRMMPFVRRVYYPGSGKDIDALKFVLDNLIHVDEIIFSDYIEQLTLDEIGSINEWMVLKEILLNPEDFNQRSWTDFWFDHPHSAHFAQPGNKESKLFILFNKKSHRLVRFYQLGTDGVGTFKILIRNKHRPNLIFLADHGFCGNWNPNIWGEPEEHDNKVSFLKEFALNNNIRYLMVDKFSTKPWTNFQLAPFKDNERWDLYTKIQNKNEPEIK